MKIGEKYPKGAKFRVIGTEEIHAADGTYHKEADEEQLPAECCEKHLSFTGKFESECLTCPVCGFEMPF